MIGVFHINDRWSEDLMKRRSLSIIDIHICLLFSGHQIRKLRAPPHPQEFRFGKSPTDKCGEFLVSRQKF